MKIKMKSNGIVVDQVNKYQYLGTLTTADTRYIQESKRRIKIAKKSFLELKDFVKSNLSMKTKKSY